MLKGVKKSINLGLNVKINISKFSVKHPYPWYSKNEIIKAKSFVTGCLDKNIKSS